MTVEIRELVIQAQVSQDSAPRALTPASTRLSREEQDRLVKLIVRQVLDTLRDERERTS
ncbi:DUF5908 family protein [Burkholderia ubonensis]|uniref:DUF5908 family protein n=1 Tax=Burkholderia ubonensis TaxID=101571 RepID=UPI000A89FB5C|nr:DUF5908 family protein [Burkholderia ubonensis]